MPALRLQGKMDLGRVGDRVGGERCLVSGLCRTATVAFNTGY
jgi:hypothetical protein